MNKDKGWCRCGTKLKTSILKGFRVWWCENCDKENK